MHMAMGEHTEVCTPHPPQHTLTHSDPLQRMFCIDHQTHQCQVGSTVTLTASTYIKRATKHYTQPSSQGEGFGQSNVNIAHVGLVWQQRYFTVLQNLPSPVPVSTNRWAHTPRMGRGGSPWGQTKTSDYRDPGFIVMPTMRPTIPKHHLDTHDRKIYRAVWSTHQATASMDLT